MFAEVRAFDWVMLGIEVLVLIAIVYEICVSHRRYQEEAKRARYLAGVRQSLSLLMDKGDSIRWLIRDPGMMGVDDVSSWVGSIKAWTEEARKWVADSPRALIVFQTFTYSDLSGNLVFNPRTKEKFILGGRELDAYRELSAYLRNLREISERLEAYF